MVLKSVLVVNKTFPRVGLELLKKEGIEVTLLSTTNDDDPEAVPEIKRNIYGYDGLIWNTKIRLSAEVLDLAGPQLKTISTMSAGFDHIDVHEVKKRGIRLGNVLQVLDNSVADITVGLMIAAARRFKEGVLEIERNEWKSGVQWMVGMDITDSTVGIVGLGGVGQTLVRRLKGFDVARFIYSGRNDKPEAKALVVERVPQDQLLRESDYVILACPLTAETRHLINADALRLMKKTAVLVNVGRGGLVDQDALYDALKEKRIFGAGLDVTTPEPLKNDHPMLSLPNCYIIPHMGSATINTRNKMAFVAAQNVIFAFNGKPMIYPIC